MFRQSKSTYFILEGVNAFATGFYFNYLFFYLRHFFGFGNAQNFSITALHGFIYFFAALNGGKFGQRRGYFFALRLGFIGMAAALAFGGVISHLYKNSPTGLWLQFPVLIVWTIAMCFTWPSLQGLVSENETPSSLLRQLGIYNVTWAACAGAANFSGGALLEKFGWETLFWLPAGLHLAQVVMVARLGTVERAATQTQSAAPSSNEITPLTNPRPIAKTKTFLRMAWLANPFAYVAINALLPAIPKLADHMKLTPMYAGFVCSVWFFARLGAFIAFWHWPGWHYKFRFLIAAYVTMVLSFAVILLMPDLFILVVGQIFFGLSLGLIYFSSLFYSMDVGETKGEHGGIHEAMIGSGVFLGPAVGATALHFLPRVENAGVLAVSTLLILGLGGLLAIWRTGNTKHQTSNIK